MAVYTDMIHMVADMEAELHAFAKRLGLQRRWYQDKKPLHPHYDLLGGKAREAIRKGALPVSSREMVALALQMVRSDD